MLYSKSVTSTHSQLHILLHCMYLFHAMTTVYQILFHNCLIKFLTTVFLTFSHLGAEEKCYSKVPLKMINNDVIHDHNHNGLLKCIYKWSTFTIISKTFSCIQNCLLPVCTEYISFEGRILMKYYYTCNNHATSIFEVLVGLSTCGLTYTSDGLQRSLSTVFFL